MVETVCTILLTYDFGNSIKNENSTWDITITAIPIGGGIGVKHIINQPHIHRKSQVAFLTQATYVYRLRVLSQIKSISWCILAVRMSKITYCSTNNLVSSWLWQTWLSLSFWYQTGPCFLFLPLYVALTYLSLTYWLRTGVSAMGLHFTGDWYCNCYYDDLVCTWQI